jgi:hypothetical protein
MSAAHCYSTVILLLFYCYSTVILLSAILDMRQIVFNKNLYQSSKKIFNRYKNRKEMIKITFLSSIEPFAGIPYFNILYPYLKHNFQILSNLTFS